MLKKTDWKNLSTGASTLDKDLKELFQLCESKRVQTIKAALADKNISTDEFEKIVPRSLIRLAMILSGPQYDFLLEQVSGESIHFIKKAKQFIETNFPHILRHKMVKSIVVDIATKQTEEGESLSDKIITGFSYIHAWLGKPPKLTPAIHIAFKNKKGKILLDSRPDWEDFSFILENLAEIFAELLESGKPLVESNQIDLAESQKVGERISKMFQHLKKITEIAPTYKITILKDKESAEGALPGDKVKRG